MSHLGVTLASRLLSTKCTELKAEWPAFRDKSRQYITVRSVVTNDVNSFNENLTLSIQKAAESTVSQTKPKRVRQFRPLPYGNNEKTNILMRKKPIEKQSKSIKQLY